VQVPLVLELAGRPVLCVGAGPVAVAKVGPLLRAGARVTVIAPAVHPDLEAAAEVLRRPVAAGDVTRDPRPWLVVAATGVATVDDAVAAEAAEGGIWCLRVDGTGDVAVPATVRRGGVLIAVTTGAPALTARLRRAVEDLVDGGWGSAADVLAGLRRDADVRAALAAVPAADRRLRWHGAVDVVLAGGDGDAARAVLVGGGP
jgi:precorrin-2 dehydrogenase/sirohydrochlorin ferrochelatase